MNFLIALVGDYNEHVIAHTAIPCALDLVSTALGIKVEWSWLETAFIKDDMNDLSKFAAIWVVPGSPYANINGVLKVIQFARETGRPFLGTCGGFQHALIEYARNVCGISDADHAEVNPDSNSLVIKPLACSLVGKRGDISFTRNTQLHHIFTTQKTNEEYHCNYGLNPEWKSSLEKAGMHFTGFDAEEQVRAFELSSHPFFIGTLFQPERSALHKKTHPLIKSFVETALKL